ncbi:MAG: PfkB family carbohydrate kinase [Oscillochloridaceae bacterium umkhey_bin13]
MTYLALGHITRDLLPTGAAPGGTVRYAAAVAHQLGLAAAVLTVGSPDQFALPPAVAVATTPSPTLSTFANQYGPTGRSQWLHALGAPLDFTAAPQAWASTPMIHLAPVAAEFDLTAALAWVAPTSLLGVTPQGWMRSWDLPLPARVRPQPWQPAPAALRRINLLALSHEDVATYPELMPYYTRHCPLVALTHGAAGATLFIHGTPHPIAPFAVAEHDPTGAGDVFAAALLIHLYQHGEPLAAARFASAAAALSVTGPGLGSLNGLAAIQQLLAA